MKKYSYLFALFTLSCGLLEQPVPAPTATITPTFRSDGKVDFLSSTTDVKSYSWDFGDGETSSEHSPSHTYYKNGMYPVGLTVQGKGGQFTTGINLRIDNIKGSAVFWKKAATGHHIQVNVDGLYSQVITGYFPSGIAPQCGASYTATFTGLSEGKHSFEAKELNSSFPIKWEGTLEVVGGECSQIHLAY